MIDKKVYKNANDKLQLSENSKVLLIRQAYNTPSKSKKQLYIKVLAASLAVILIGGVVYFNNFEKKEYGFSIMVQAADKNAQTEINKKGIKVNCEQYGNMILQERVNDEFVPYKDKNGKENLLMEFVLSNFEISSENIDTVTFTLNGDKQYFSIDSTSKNITAAKPLTNSNYSENELSTYLDGHNTKVFCDEFIYKKPTDKDNVNHINFGSHISIVSETNRSNKKIDQLTAKYFDYTEKINEEKIKLYKETNGVGGGKTPEILEKYYLEQHEITDEILALELEDVNITITVKTTDNKESSKTIKLGFDQTEAYGQKYNWLTMQLME